MAINGYRDYTNTKVSCLLVGDPDSYRDTNKGAEQFLVSPLKTALINAGGIPDTNHVGHLHAGHFTPPQ